MDRDEIELAAMRWFPEDFPIPNVPCDAISVSQFPGSLRGRETGKVDPEPPAWVKAWDEGFYAIPERP